MNDSPRVCDEPNETEYLSSNETCLAGRVKDDTTGKTPSGNMKVSTEMVPVVGNAENRNENTKSGPLIQAEKLGNENRMKNATSHWLQ